MADGLFIEPLPEEGQVEALMLGQTALDACSDQNIPATPSSAASLVASSCDPSPTASLPKATRLRLLTPEEVRAAAAFGSLPRRREYLAWRAVVRREVGADAVISYNDVGAPVVENYPVHISVSHCRGYVAVCISDSPCAVDIERPDRDFGRVVPRYLSPREQSLSSDRLFPGVAWCAKEALYKLSGRAGLDLLQDLRIESYNAEAGTVLGRIENGEPIELSVCRGEEFIAVYFR